MKNLSVQKQRRSIRLKDYDYGQAGAYFVTVCTWKRKPTLAQIENGSAILTDFGLIVSEEWCRSVSLRKEIELDAFVIMPNHIHGIIIFHDVGATGRSPHKAKGPTKQSLGALIAGFKASVTLRVNEKLGTPGTPFWQRNYYEHVIRDEESLRAYRKYIKMNPLSWDLDKENMAAAIKGR